MPSTGTEGEGEEFLSEVEVELGILLLLSKEEIIVDTTKASSVFVSGIDNKVPLSFVPLSISTASTVDVCSVFDDGKPWEDDDEEELDVEEESFSGVNPLKKYDVNTSRTLGNGASIKIIYMKRGR